VVVAPVETVEAAEAAQAVLSDLILNRYQVLTASQSAVVDLHL
jgi:hypothetical protein